MQWPVEFKTTIDSKEFKQFIRQAQKSLKNLTPALKKSGIVMIRSFDLNFKREGRPRKWKALTKNTIAGRRKFSKRILQDTGRLRMSALARTAKGNIYRLTKDSLKMGSNLKIAPFHQFGTKPYVIRPRNKKVLKFTVAGSGGPKTAYAKKVNHPGLPARPFILIQGEDAIVITQIFGDHVIGD